MTDDRRNVAIAIRSCLVELERRANRTGLGDLAHFVGLAVLAADDAVAANAMNEAIVRVLNGNPAGHC
jgi:hypothetical protein